MQDRELARIILEKLRDSSSPTHAEDLVALARSSGAEAWPQITRVSRELTRRGLVTDYDETDQSIYARISAEGLRSLEGGGPEIDHTERVDPT
jgi:hypothetical protein